MPEYDGMPEYPKLIDTLEAAPQPIMPDLEIARPQRPNIELKPRSDRLTYELKPAAPRPAPEILMPARRPPALELKPKADRYYPPFDWRKSSAKPGPYMTTLPPQQELQFQAWVEGNHIPYDEGPHSDYDMRGYWKDVVRRGRDATQLNATDGQPHFPDTYKTPYHRSFSNESKYANKTAPHWNDRDQLVDDRGVVYFDERSPNAVPW